MIKFWNIVILGKEILDNMGKDFIFGFMEVLCVFIGDFLWILLKLFIMIFSFGIVSVLILVLFVKDIYFGENIIVIKGVVR